MTLFSTLESSRFGMRVGRVSLTADVDSTAVVRELAAGMDDERLDVLILRFPASDVTMAAHLATVDTWSAIPADTLMYWEWRDRSGPTAKAATGRTVRRVDDVDHVDRLVRDVFPGYPNHYAANPLFSQQAALEGYCEWARRLIGSGDATCIVLVSDTNAEVGFGIVDWSPEVPDVRLAGVLPEFRGRGCYRELVAAMMSEAAERTGCLRISTQAHNLPPMRTWAGLGWKPFETLTTIHLVRRDLLLR